MTAFEEPRRACQQCGEPTLSTSFEGRYFALVTCKKCATPADFIDAWNMGGVLAQKRNLPLAHRCMAWLLKNF